MSARERLAVTLALAAVGVFLPGYLLHAAPRFPGSLAGSLLGIAAALLFILLVVYTLVKRVAALKRRIRLGAVLTFHVYAGAVGAVLGVLHTGHQYRSPLAIALVITMLVVVLSGFIGRYYLAQVGTDLRTQQQQLGVLRARHDSLLSGQGTGELSDRYSNFAFGLPLASIRAIVAAIADLEYAIARRESLKVALSRWVVLHVAAALAFYPLLALHTWSGIYYGLRWLR